MAVPTLHPRTPLSSLSLSLFLWLLSTPRVSQGELHSYCTASNDGKVRFSSQSQKARDAPAHQLPDNGTDCGWAPFGKFSICSPAPTPAPVLTRKASSTGGDQSWLAGLAPLAQLILAVVTMPLDRCNHASSCKLVPPPSKPVSRLQLLLCLQCPCAGLSLSAEISTLQDLLPGDQRWG